MKQLFLGLICCTSVLFSCHMGDDFTKDDSPTTGKLVLMYDEGLKLQIENQVKTFLNTYGYADIQLVSSDERTAIEALFNDSCKAIAISRQLTEDELKKFQSKNIRPQTSVVATSAIVFIVNRNFPDSTISINQIRELLKGTDTLWSRGQHINVGFANANSGCTRQLKDSLIPGNAFGKNCLAMATTKELVQRIGADMNSLGVCDYAWLSDKDDP